VRDSEPDRVNSERCRATSAMLLADSLHLPRHPLAFYRSCISFNNASARGGHTTGCHSEHADRAAKTAKKTEFLKRKYSDVTGSYTASSRSTGIADRVTCPPVLTPRLLHRKGYAVAHKPNLTLLKSQSSEEGRSRSLFCHELPAVLSHLPL
jgi:hypothetical protein